MATPTASCPYTDVPLGQNRNCTRLLTLYSGESTDKLRCSLRAADFHLDKQYEALSYTWGDIQDTSSILLNGTDFQATKNLIAALEHLRLDGKDRVLWVDALCINQADEDEINEHLQRMGQIYANARVVLVWLGEAVQFDIMNQGIDDPTTRAKDFISRTVELLNAGLLTWRTIAPTPDDLLGPYVGCVGRLLQSKWFQRLWVLQEMALAEEVLVVRGRTFLPWDEISQAMEALRGIPAPSHSLKILAKHYNNKLAIARFCRNLRHNIPTREKFEAKNLADRVATLLLLTNGLNATKPRDHLYALLGLIGTRDEITVEPSLVPSSELSTEDVLKNLAIYLLRTRGNLDILYGVSWVNMPLRETLPSWVPSWDCILSGHLRRYFDPNYAPMHSPPNPAEFYVDEDILHVKAFYIGQIESIGIDAPTQEDSDSVSRVRALFKSWEESCLMKACEKRDATLDELLPEWLKTLFHWDEHGDDSHEQLLYLTLMGHLSLLDLDSSGDLEGALPLFCSLESSRLKCLTPFVTYYGYIGLPDHRVELKSGDWVWLFHGCTVPYMLREVDTTGRYRILGPCYMWTHMYHADIDKPVVSPSLESGRWISIV